MLLVCDGYKTCSLITHQPLILILNRQMVFWVMVALCFAWAVLNLPTLSLKPIFFVKNNVQLLVTSLVVMILPLLPTNLTFWRIKFPIQNIHVPKQLIMTCPPYRCLPLVIRALRKKVRIGRTIYEDAPPSGNWFVISLWDAAGHLAFGIGASCHYPMIVIPEMFNKTKLTLDKITKLIVFQSKGKFWKFPMV